MLISCSGKMKLAIAAGVFLFVVASYVLIADAKKGPVVTDIVRHLRVFSLFSFLNQPNAFSTRYILISKREVKQ